MNLEFANLKDEKMPPTSWQKKKIVDAQDPVQYT